MRWIIYVMEWSGVGLSSYPPPSLLLCQTDSLSVTAFMDCPFRVYTCQHLCAQLRPIAGSAGGLKVCHSICSNCEDVPLSANGPIQVPSFIVEEEQQQQRTNISRSKSNVGEIQRTTYTTQLSSLRDDVGSSVRGMGWGVFGNRFKDYIHICLGVGTPWVQQGASSNPIMNVPCFVIFSSGWPHIGKRPSLVLLTRVYWTKCRVEIFDGCRLIKFVSKICFT